MAKKIRQLKADLSNAKVESEFEGFLKRPIANEGTSVIIEKLRKL
jgi:hypothetical protein